ncbi:hypothetical protein niasHS_006834 [Heterodera schachtii]|uniref:5-demethoxyubiquinone hydroxylase, mitochondrial n=1 Tax=Heterodera schachtii TaxID=97005 RepID=A0ABD2JIM5_HETSC
MNFRPFAFLSLRFSSSSSSLLPSYRKAIVHPIVRVDHAGELAADRIYAGQLAVLPKTHRLVPIIEQMRREEKHHLDEMERLIVKYGVRPTALAPICSVAGFMLGVGTALLGEKAAMACTIAVEEVIGQHYNDQIKELMADDANANRELMEKLAQFRDEELEHHDTGVQHQGLEAPFYDALKTIIQTGCKTAIWITQRI